MKNGISELLSRRRALKVLASGLVVPGFDIFVPAKAQPSLEGPESAVFGNKKAASGGAASYHLQEALGATISDDNDINPSGSQLGEAYSWTPGSSYLLRRVDCNLFKKSGTITGQTYKARIFTIAAAIPSIQQGSDSASVSGTLITGTSQGTATKIQFIFPGDITVTSGTALFVAIIASAVDGTNVASWTDTATGAGAAAAWNGTTWSNLCSACIQGTFDTYSFS